jgi:uncharacterized protein (TIGR02271 family)
MENRKYNHTNAERHHDLNQLFGYDVVDSHKESVGTIDNIWVDDAGQPAFFGIQTGWLGKVHVVPAHGADVNYEGRKIRLHHPKDKVKDAPSFDTSADLSREQEDEVYRYYGLSRGATTAPTTQRETAGMTDQPEAPIHREKADLPYQEIRGVKHPEQTGLGEHPKGHLESDEEKTIQLNEEEARVRKQERDAGGVRLRKIIRTETVHKPVELKHEDIEIERVPSGEGEAAGSDLREDETYIPLRREEATLEKETHAKEQVKVHKKTTSEEKELSGEVRQEDLEIDRDEGEERRYGT